MGTEKAESLLSQQTPAIQLGKDLLSSLGTQKKELSQVILHTLTPALDLSSQVTHTDSSCEDPVLASSNPSVPCSEGNHLPPPPRWHWLRSRNSVPSQSPPSLLLQALTTDEFGKSGKNFKIDIYLTALLTKECLSCIVNSQWRSYTVVSSGN